MKIWILKAVIQKTISLLPFKHRINYLFQRYVTRGLVLTDAIIEDKLTHCRSHLDFFEAHASVGKGSALEIGTGWYPIVPIGLYLCGFSKVVTLDLSSLLTTQSVHGTVEYLLRYHESGKLAEYLPEADPERMAVLRGLLSDQSDPKELLQKLNITAIVGDARKIDYPDNAFDLINSNNTFEHIYPEILTDIVKEFKRLLKPGGIMSHHIDMSDHFAHLDKTITVFNYLKFSDAAWRWIDNSIQPQNRMRISDYKRMFDKLGLKVLGQRDWVGKVAELRTVEIAEKYRSYSEEEIVVTHSIFALAK